MKRILKPLVWFIGSYVTAGLLLTVNRLLNILCTGGPTPETNGVEECLHGDTGEVALFVILFIVSSALWLYLVDLIFEKYI